MKTFKEILPGILLIIFQIVVGVLLIIDPKHVTATAFLIFGIALLAAAVFALIRFLRARRNDEESLLTLVSAILAFIIGAVFAFGHVMLAELLGLLAVVYGAILIISGVFKISEYFSLKKANMPVSFIRVLSGLVTLALGVVILFNPFGAIDVLGIAIGVSLLIGALIDIIALISGRRKGINEMYAATADDDDYDLE